MRGFSLLELVPGIGYIKDVTMSGSKAAAQNFRLNMGLEPQLVSGAMPSPGSSSINKITNKLDDFSKARKLRVSDLDEVGDDTFTWTLRGEKVTLNGVKVKPVEYVKRSQEELLLLRKEFNSTVRRDFLQQLSLDKERLIKLGFTDSDILKLADGKYHRAIRSTINYR